MWQTLLHQGEMTDMVMVHHSVVILPLYSTCRGLSVNCAGGAAWQTALGSPSED